MSLKEIAKQNAAELKRQRQTALDDVKKPLAKSVEDARAAIPQILSELTAFDLYRKREIDVMDWKTVPGGMPDSLGKLLDTAEGVRNNLGVVQRFLARFDALSPEDAWGNRADGQRDANRTANLRGEFNFTLALGSLRTIREIRQRLEFEVSQVAASIARNTQRDVVELTVPTPQPQPLIVLTTLNHEEDF